MSKKVKILIACGSGIATSTVAKHEAETVCINAGLDVEVKTTSIAHLLDEHKYHDVICTTSPYRGELGRPVINIFGLISNIGRTNTEKELITAVKEVAEK